MCQHQCYEIGGPWIAENPDCPEHGSNKHGDCGYQCHQVGGPFIAENPECPQHGAGNWGNYKE